ncbi:MAG: hypothetical protein NTY48_04935 [Candidatus Diapherotrites archaeon]|nr:hypothetical protein [Candidatus Diapherotrites archaeon]
MVNMQWQQERRILADLKRPTPDKGGSGARRNQEGLEERKDI